MSASSPRSFRYAQRWEDLVGVFDAELAEPQIEGISIGSTLTDLLVIEFLNGGGRWGIVQRCLDRLRRLRRCLAPSKSPCSAGPIGAGQIFVTWRLSTARIDDLILPMLRALSPDRCTVLYNDANILQKLPKGTQAVHWIQAITHDRRRWHSAFRLCWPHWRLRLQSLCKSFDMPQGAIERLSLAFLVNSQHAIGSLELLERCRPAAIVTDYDRARLPSCLVLAARSLGIPTFSLQHGVLDEHAVGFVPVIADHMFCWGELHRRILIEAGTDPAKLAIGGCPRLTRDLLAEPRTIRGRLRINPADRVVMLGTSPIAPSQRRLLAAWFCEAVSQLEGVSGIVRLHPSEDIAFYAEIARKYPQVTFLDNSRFSLDESFAASDVVVVQSSGLGSDALVKRRLAIVVNLPDVPLGHGKDLIEQAGCPRVASPGELAGSLQSLLFNRTARQRQLAAGERYVEDFCAHFGEDSACRISEFVLQSIHSNAECQP